MSYRLRRATKRVGNKLRRYTNLAVFNSECPSRGWSGNICTLTNIRRLKDGEGLATVKTRPGVIGRKRPAGTWLLHFADYTILKSHLKRRVDEERPGMLSGVRRRRR